jgi:hypothetical protein
VPLVTVTTCGSELLVAGTEFVLPGSGAGAEFALTSPEVAVTPLSAVTEPLTTMTFVPAGNAPPLGCDNRCAVRARDELVRFGISRT